MAEFAEDPWPQRAAFVELVQRFKDDHPKTRNADLAIALKITVGSLKQYMYGNAVPGINLLTRMCEFFGVKLSHLWHDPGAEAAGVSLAQESGKRKMLLQMIVEALQAKDLSDDEVGILYDDFQAAISRLRSLKALQSKVHP